MLKSRFTSSLEKPFADSKIGEYPKLEKISVLKGERLNLQFLYIYEREGNEEIYTRRALPILEGKLKEYATIRRVMHIPVTLPFHAAGYDDNMLRVKPGLFPDVLDNLYYEGKTPLSESELFSLWIEIDVPKDFEACESELSLEIDFEKFGKASDSVKIEVINATLPDEDIYFTQWFHADCLANYYRVESFSDEHWRIIENFARVASKNGITMLLTPVFTPPLDTAVGGERRTTQLVDVTVNDGKYTFGFDKLDRWVEMCDRVGIKYFEISHLYTQWGAEHAPKIMATVNGEYKKIFGWETEACSPEYKNFLRCFLTELLSHLKKSGNDKRCIFHISDEPSLEHLENYKAAKEQIADILDGYLVMDALSRINFYKTGVVKNPIPASNHIDDFIEAGVEGLWTYYCISQWKGVSNRYHSMPACRNRSIGMQIYKYNIVGFLHWGYNFYNNQFSDSPINPYLETSSGNGFAAGDAYSVYPGIDGECLESMRIKVFHEALQDIKAMKLCEKLYTHEEVVAAIEEVFGRAVRFNDCAHKASEILAIREKINLMIKAKA